MVEIHFYDKNMLYTKRDKLLYLVSYIFGKFVISFPNNTIIASVLLWTYPACSIGLSSAEVELFWRLWTAVSNETCKKPWQNWLYLTIAQLRTVWTKTKSHVPISLFVALRLSSRADSRSGVHITIIYLKRAKLCVFGVFLRWNNRYLAIFKICAPSLW